MELTWTEVISWCRAVHFKYNSKIKLLRSKASVNQTSFTVLTVNPLHHTISLLIDFLYQHNTEAFLPFNINCALKKWDVYTFYTPMSYYISQDISELPMLLFISLQVSMEYLTLPCFFLSCSLLAFLRQEMAEAHRRHWMPQMASETARVETPVVSPGPSECDCSNVSNGVRLRFYAQQASGFHLPPRYHGGWWDCSLGECRGREGATPEEHDVCFWARQMPQLSIAPHLHVQISTKWQ